MYEFGAEEQEAVCRVLESGMLFRYMEGAVEVDRLEVEVARRMGARHSVATSSGTGALVSALGALGIGPGDEVLVPAYAYIADVLAVLAVGAVPVVCEVDEGLALDPAEIGVRSSERTRAVMPVHMCGWPGDMDRIMAEAHNRDLFVVEDACQAFGATYRGRSLGTIGHVGAFSFNQAKILTAGEGGAVVTEEQDLYERAFVMHDGSSSFEGKEFAWPTFAGSAFRMSEMTAAVLRIQLTRLDGILVRLRGLSLCLRELLETVPGIHTLRSADPSGESGTNVAVRFPDEDSATRFVNFTNHMDGVWAMRGIALGHSFFEWEMLHERRGGHHDRLNPLRGASRVQTTDELPRSKDLLGRTVIIGYSMEVKKETFERIAEAVERS